MKTYSKKDDIPVGGIMKRKNGKMYEAKSLSNQGFCLRCAFADKTSCGIVRCTPSNRADKQDVYFIRREDLEETKAPQANTDSQVKGEIE